MFESSKLHCRLHCLGVEVTNGYRGHVFRLGPCFFLSISQTQLLRMCLFPCEAYDSRKGGQTHHPKKKMERKKPWAQTNNSLPNNHVRHNEASFNSTKWRCPYDNVTYCKFHPKSKTATQTATPPLHMARTEWTCIGSDGSMTVNISWKTHLQMKFKPIKYISQQYT